MSSKSVITDAEITAWKKLGAPDHRCSYEAWMDFFNRALATITSLRLDLQRTREALLTLANACDDVGVIYFDTDNLDPEVKVMRDATQTARAILTPPTGT